MRFASRSRGQVLPLWIAGILGGLALIFTALNYGNTLRWHIRAQNAADAAAQATLALQSERWNEMTELLYAMNVEEYRTRHLLNSILLASSGSGHCFFSQTNPSNTQTQDCGYIYDTLTPQYVKSVARYSAEAELLNKISVNATYTNWAKDAKSLVNHLQDPAHCNQVGQATYNNDGGDCAFQYNFNPGTITAQSSQRTHLESILETGQYLQIPSYGHATTFDMENPEFFAPAQVDIVTCAKVPPLIPSFFGVTSQPFYAIGRATATNVMFVEDWLEPGAVIDPDRADGNFFQPVEDYGAPAAPNDRTDWNLVDFGGNAATDHTDSDTFSSGTARAEMSVRLGWWNSIPLHPTNTYATPTVAADCPTTLETSK